jgi:predicted CXXCH cytochrome family protein
MSAIRLIPAALLFLTFAPAALPSGAADCAPCHSRIYQTYRRTGMGRSFYRATPGETVADFYHQASDTHYSMSVRDGQYYQRRWQKGFDGNETNAEEMKVDYVIGSGNHSRIFVSRSPRGAFIELPLGWYAEKGGYWAMTLGYDSAAPPSHRPIAYECMFCHNAYPQIPAGHGEPASEPEYTGVMPEGIDCQRCHGPGEKHIQLAGRGAAVRTEDVRAAIVNPGRLGKQQQMEVCMQCHLETAATRLPSAIRRFDRGPFSYVPGDPLGSFEIFFDHAPGTGYDDKFDTVGAAYRFGRSQCFLKSKGEMVCETCHDPHNIPRGAEASVYYAGICRQCHGATVERLAASGAHTSNADCISCHMPKRRAEDAVHEVVTDHRIERRPPARDLLAPIPESHPAAKDEYHGEVVLYYPPALPPAPDNELYLALAQVAEARNLPNGIPRLTQALAQAVSPAVDFYIELGNAWRAAGNPAKAAEAYQKAVVVQPDSARASRNLGIALQESGQSARAEEALKRAIQLGPKDAPAWMELGLVATSEGRIPQGLEYLEHAREINPDLPEVWNGIGVNRSAARSVAEAEKALREALRIDPYHATANGNLAKLLAGRGDLTQALFYFNKAARLQPDDAALHYAYALTLARHGDRDAALAEYRAAAKSSDPQIAGAAAEALRRITATP